MAVVPAPRPVDLRAAEAALGGYLRLAREEEFVARFPHCEMGAEPPFGSFDGMPVLVDESLERGAEIVFNAGTHDEAIRMRYSDFERLVHPRRGCAVTRPLSGLGPARHPSPSRRP